MLTTKVESHIYHHYMQNILIKKISIVKLKIKTSKHTCKK